VFESRVPLIFVHSVLVVPDQLFTNRQEFSNKDIIFRQAKICDIFATTLPEAYHLHLGPVFFPRDFVIFLRVLHFLDVTLEQDVRKAK